MPEPGYLLLAMLVSSIGFVMLMYGKKQRRPLQLVAGIVMFVYPYFVHDLVAMSALCVALCGGVWFGVNKMGL